MGRHFHTPVQYPSQWRSRMLSTPARIASVQPLPGAQINTDLFNSLGPDSVKSVGVSEERPLHLIFILSATHLQTNQVRTTFKLIYHHILQNWF